MTWHVVVAQRRSGRPDDQPGLRAGGGICQAGDMSAGPPASRLRSSAAIVMTRADPPPVTTGGPAPAPAPPRDWQWLWWIPLALLVAGAWALLLFGDSLRSVG